MAHGLMRHSIFELAQTGADWRTTAEISDFRKHPVNLAGTGIELAQTGANLVGNVAVTRRNQPFPVAPVQNGNWRRLAQRRTGSVAPVSPPLRGGHNWRSTYRRPCPKLSAPVHVRDWSRA